MQSLDLLCLLGELDDGMIADAKAEYKSKTPRIVKWGALAACCCLIAAAAFSAPKLLSRPEQPEVPTLPAAAAEVPAAAPAEQPAGAPQSASGTISPIGEANPGTAERPTPDPANPPEPGTVWDEPSEVFGPMQSPGEEPPTTEVQTMIQGFGDALLVDMAVENGGVCYSQQLVDMLAACGDSVRYRVTVELFRDGVQVYSGSEEARAEMERLFDEAGIITALETYNDGYTEQSYFTLHATAEQLADFPGSSEYGYFLMLYNEHFGPQADGGEIPEEVNGQPDVIFGINENFR